MLQIIQIGIIFNMDSQEPFDVTLIKSLLETLVEDIYKRINADIETNISQIVAKIESYEQQIATIILAYGEQAVMMEALASQVAYASKEAQEAFKNELIKKRKLMFEVMNDASTGFVAQQDSGLGKALSDLVEEKSSNPD